MEIFFQTQAYQDDLTYEYQKITLPLRFWKLFFVAEEGTWLSEL